LLRLQQSGGSGLKKETFNNTKKLDSVKEAGF
jgi:hypothetical protein